jgi:predicted CXXCH cytochrome family protein
MDIRTIAVLTSACSLLFSTGHADTALPATSQPTASYQLPKIKNDCGICHLSTGASVTGELKKKLSDLCLDCHSNRTYPLEHKVDIVPKMDVQGLPLADGKVTCVTCHDPHANLHGKMLRMRSKDLCLVCHPM